MKARGPVWGPTGPSLCSQHSKLKMTDIGKPFVACPALQAPMQESHDYLMAPKCHSRLTQGLRKAATETRPVTLEQDTQWNICIEPVIHLYSYIKPTHRTYYYHLQYHYRHKKSCSKQPEFWVFESYSPTQL